MSTPVDTSSAQYIAALASLVEAIQSDSAGQRIPTASKTLQCLPILKQQLERLRADADVSSLMRTNGKKSAEHILSDVQAGQLAATTQSAIAAEQLQAVCLAIEEGRKPPRPPSTKPVAASVAPAVSAPAAAAAPEKAAAPKPGPSLSASEQLLVDARELDADQWGKTSVFDHPRGVSANTAKPGDVFVEPAKSSSKQTPSPQPLFFGKSIAFVIILFFFALYAVFSDDFGGHKAEEAKVIKPLPPPKPGPGAVPETARHAQKNWYPSHRDSEGERRLELFHEAKALHESVNGKALSTTYQMALDVQVIQDSRAITVRDALGTDVSRWAMIDNSGIFFYKEPVTERMCGRFNHRAHYKNEVFDGIDTRHYLQCLKYQGTFRIVALGSNTDVQTVRQYSPALFAEFDKDVPTAGPGKGLR